MGTPLRQSAKGSPTVEGSSYQRGNSLNSTLIASSASSWFRKSYTPLCLEVHHSGKLAQRIFPVFRSTRTARAFCGRPVTTYLNAYSAEAPLLPEVARESNAIAECASSRATVG